MTLPPKDGFATNVNISVVIYGEDMEAYIKLSKEGFATYNITLLKESKTGENEWSIEYTGEMGNRKLHWYARAILSHGKCISSPLRQRRMTGQVSKLSSGKWWTPLRSKCLPR